MLGETKDLNRVKISLSQLCARPERVLFVFNGPLSGQDQFPDRKILEALASEASPEKDPKPGFKKVFRAPGHELIASFDPDSPTISHPSVDASAKIESVGRS